MLSATRHHFIWLLLFVNGSYLVLFYRLVYCFYLRIKSPVRILSPFFRMLFHHFCYPVSFRSSSLIHWIFKIQWLIFFFFSLSNLVRCLIRLLPDASGFSTIRHVSVQIAAGGAPSPIRTATITQTISFCSNYANESIISILTQLTTQLAA